MAGASGNAKFSAGTLATAHGQGGVGMLAGNAGGVARWLHVPLEQHELDWLDNSGTQSVFATVGLDVATGQQQTFGTVILPARNITANRTRVMLLVSSLAAGKSNPIPSVGVALLTAEHR